MAEHTDVDELEGIATPMEKALWPTEQALGPTVEALQPTVEALEQTTKTDHKSSENAASLTQGMYDPESTLPSWEPNPALAVFLDKQFRKLIE